MSSKAMLVAEVIELNGRRYESDEIRRTILRGELKTLGEVVEMLEEKHDDLMKLIEHKENHIGDI